MFTVPSPDMSSVEFCVPDQMVCARPTRKSCVGLLKVSVPTPGVLPWMLTIVVALPVPPSPTRKAPPAMVSVLPAAIWVVWADALL